MGTLCGKGEISRQVDDTIGAMVYSIIGRPSVEEQLRHHLTLSQKSVCILHAHIKDLQRKNQVLEARYNGAKEEAFMNASALRKKIGEFDVLKGAYDQLLKECELFRNDREIFAEAADDAEERRAEADKRAADAEFRAIQAEQKEKAAKSFIDSVMKAPHRDRLQIVSSPEFKARWTAITGTEGSELSRSVSKDLANMEHGHTRLGHLHDMQEATKSANKKTSSPELKARCAGITGSQSTELSCSARKGQVRWEHDSTREGQVHDTYRISKSANKKKVGIIECNARSPTGILLKEARGTKRVFYEACKAREDIRNVVRQKIGNSVLVDRGKLSGTICKVGRLQSSDEKENFNNLELEARAKIDEAALSDDETVRYLADLLVILKRNLVKAEAEGDLIYAKYCEIHKLLMDTLETFGILPEMCEDGVVS